MAGGKIIQARHPTHIQHRGADTAKVFFSSRCASQFIQVASYQKNLPLGSARMGRDVTEMIYFT